MKSIVTSVIYLIEPPYTEPYVRWSERTGASRPLLLDYIETNIRGYHYCLAYNFLI